MSTSTNLISSNHNLIGHRIDQGRLEFMSVLGLGAYGVVYLARDLTSPDMQFPKLYAVKALNKVGLDVRQKSFQRREIALHSLASSHPSIVTLHAVIESPSCIFVILDYCPDGDLFGMITEKQKYLGKAEAIKSVFIQIVDAVQFCHRLGFSHRDLKPENILCKKNGAEVVLADFGLATAEKTSSDFGCGSTFYMSPECQGGLLERPTSYSTLHNDIWSLGVILVNLTCGRNPWKQACPTDETFRAYLSNPDFLRSILPISESCNSLLKRIFAINPYGRISLEELKDEVLRIENFNMTTIELSKATRATREAARAWLKDLTNPKTQPTAIEFSSWKDVLSKKPKNFNARGLKIAEGSASKRTARYPPIRKQPSRNDVQPIGPNCLAISSSVSGYDCPARDDKPGCYQSRSGPIVTVPPKSHIVSPHGVALTNLLSTPPSGEVPTKPMVFNLQACAVAKASSTSSNDLSKRPQGFSSRLRKISHVASTFSQSSKQEPPILISRKKLFPKPMSFARPNAPCPIIVKPYMADAPLHPPKSAFSSHLVMTPNSKKGRMLLPCTPPPSVSPAKNTFGFIKKPNRFSSSIGHTHELPPTPLTPDHPANVVATPSLSIGCATPSPSRRHRKILPRSPLSMNNREKRSRNLFASLYSDENINVVLDDSPDEKFQTKIESRNEPLPHLPSNGNRALGNR